jgi:nanoRNase/pAp phosphatase (c-di-AMP/oligoRNAs hydrolase)
MFRGRLARFPFRPLARLHSVVIICHRHADVDAYCAAVALRALLQRLKPRLVITLVAPDGLGALAQKVQRRFRAPVVETAGLEHCSLVVVVDTGHAALLGSLAPLLATTPALRVFIDHHPTSPSIRQVADVLLVDRSASSASEVVYRLFTAKRRPLSRRLAQVLLTGILFDSQHLTIARGATLEVVAALSRAGASITGARALLHTPRERSEVIARLKAAQRLRAYQLGPWVVATALVGSFQASAARALVDLGADVAIVAGVHEGQARCSLRSSQHFARVTKLHLGTQVVTRVAAAQPEAVGGGHPTAASLTARAAPEAVTAMVLELLGQQLGARPERIT